MILEWVVTNLISIFMNNKLAIYKFWIFEFQTLFSNVAILAYFEPKLPYL